MKRREFESHANLHQIAGFSRYTLQDGLESGVEIIEIRSGNGLRVGVCPWRGLDITFAELNGVNLTWRHPNGAIHPAFYSENNFDWLRGAPSGLVTTCGLESFGPPCEIAGEKWGIHDRISYLPAREVSAQTLWHDEENCEFRLSGSVHQTRLFGANLTLNRAISVNLGENRLVLRDEIRNAGFESAPFCVLYHCNFGFPFVEASVVLSIDSDVTPRDAEAQSGLENWAQIEAPTPNFKEQVFFHDLRAEKTGRASLWNAKRKVGVALRFSRAQLPFFTQWKMLGAGAYVLGLEPSNAPLANRETLLERGEMPVLEAGESRDFELEFEFLSEKL
ncbi:MAG: aldose 1-epimerase family protein [Armatimonadetes bacterium]|nr:aldose 1-epimerase family protein [Armatimonadota bacterium]